MEITLSLITPSLCPLCNAHAAKNWLETANCCGKWRVNEPPQPSVGNLELAF